jgi:hypothetical protein
VLVAVGDGVGNFVLVAVGDGVGDFVVVAVEAGVGEGLVALGAAVGALVALGELLEAGMVVALVGGMVLGFEVGF